MVMRGIALTVPTLVNPIDFNTTHLHAFGNERVYLKHTVWEYLCDNNRLEHNKYFPIVPHSQVLR